MKKPSWIDEFKTFLMRGNVIDLAVGVVIGAAFGKITTSLVNDIIMPLIGLITGGIDLTQWNIVLNRAAVAAGDAAPVMLGIGNLLAVILDFIIVAFAMFLLVKGMNKLASLKKKEEEPAPEEEPKPTSEGSAHRDPRPAERAAEMRESLTRGLAQLGLSPDAVPQLEAYAAALLEKNRVMNLTAITAPQDVATLHLLDCATLLTMADLRGKRVIDVGTGAGFPGMVLRILEPDFDLTLLDSLGKRIDFLKEVCSQLGLARVDCVHARAEEYAAGHRQQYDIAASRAVANLNVLCELALPLVKVGGQFLAMKSVSSDDEIAGARGAIGQLGGRIADIRDYTVPETEVRHRLVIVEKVKDTPAIYPRSFARIKKAPLK